MIGETISHYEILEKLGAGGMGVVYKAQDIKLNRAVALKFLPPHLSSLEADKARFIQEAQSASALNHPNVCTIHDIQEHDGQMFIVMEFVHGQTLRDLMGGKTAGGSASGGKAVIPLNRAIEIGVQVADGLAAAHEKGIVHRDVKPENIMVRKDGIAQIMDFGLAKLRFSQESRLTKEGSTVGTAGYMSPEQIQGLETDHRSDIFSLGVLLYELFTGELPFRGVHETALLYEIVNVDPPPMTTINPDLNPELDRIVFECLQKEPDERFQSAKDISKELKRYKRDSSRQRATRTMSTRQFQRPPEPTSPATSVPDMDAGVSSVSSLVRLKKFLLPGISGILAILVIVLLLTRPTGEGTFDQQVMRFPIDISVTAPPIVLGSATLAISPDGKNMVYLAGPQTNPQLFLRPLDQFDAKTLVGSEGASDPFFSPDGQWVAFFASGKIKKLSIFGGAVQEVCDVPGFMRGGFWADDNSIWFGHLNRGIYRVPPDGHIPAEVTRLDSATGEISHRFPQLLPGGKWVIFTLKPSNITSFDDAIIVAENIETHERHELVRGGSWGHYVPTGHLMYARGSTVYAAPFDVKNVKVTGPPLSLFEGDMLNPLSGTANFDVSRTGVLVYLPVGPTSGSNTTVSWMDRRGSLTPLLSDPQPYDNPKLSPDGSKIALTIRAANDDIWTYDISRGSLTRLTFGGGNSDYGLWSPDGAAIIFASEMGRAVVLFRKSWNGTGGAERIGNENGVSFTFRGALTIDGKNILYGVDGDIRMMAMQSDAKWTPLIHSSAFEDAPSFSPDGHLLAYLSDESGRNEIYIVPYPSLNGKWQISTGGPSTGAIWSPNGQELFYGEGSRLMKVDVINENGVHFSPPRKECDLPPSTFNIFDISRDGKRFLIGLSESRKIQATQIDVVVGWFSELKRRFSSVVR